MPLDIDVHVGSIPMVHNYTPAPADAVGLTDAVTAELGPRGSVNDMVGVADAASVAQASQRTQADAVGLTDSVSAALNTHPVSQSDNLGITDAAAAIRAMFRAPADLVGLTDARTLVQTNVRTRADSIGLTDSASAIITPGGALTHGSQLTKSVVGPWSLQGVSPGSETLTSSTPPGGVGTGWDITSPSDYGVPGGTYVYNNSPSNHGGTVPGGGLTIDGIFIPAGTIVCQFKDLSNGDFNAQGRSGSYLFRGCRFRQHDIGQSSQFNDNTATYTNRLFYCDMGSDSSLLADWQGPFWKAIGGTDHGVLRTYFSNQYVTFQPNVPNCYFIENMVEDLIFYGGDPGPPGNGGSLHMASVGCEGGGTGFRFMRNWIVPKSPDLEGHVFDNGASLAFEGTNGSNYSDCQIVDNYLSGLNYVVLDFGEVAGASSIVITGNKVTTKYFTNGGASGCEQAGNHPVAWGSAGNVKSNNTWADDYGTGGDGNTPTSSRQFPAGNGPRAGTTAF